MPIKRAHAKGKKDPAKPPRKAGGKAAKARRPRMGSSRATLDAPSPTAGENLFMPNVAAKKNGTPTPAMRANLPVKKAIRRETAETMATKQKDIAVSEF